MAAAGVVQGTVSQHFYTVFPQSSPQALGPPASVSQMLGLQVCTTTPGLQQENALYTNDD